MRSTATLLFASFAAALVLLMGSAPAQADTIVTRSGQRIAGATIDSETLAGVVYRVGRAAAVTLPVEEVARIEYDRRPRLIQDAEVQLADGDRSGAFQTLQLYLDGQIETGADARRFPWAAAYAARRAIDVAQSLQAHREVAQTATKLIRHFGESRHVPFAYLAKAEAELRLGERDQAVRTLDEFAALVESRDLSKAWALEVRLARTRADAQMSSAARLAALEAIAADAADHRGVRLRTQVARGEALVSLGVEDAARRQEHLRRARELFREVQAADGADDRTRAGALSGLADSHFLGADPATDKDAVREARDLYLRVAVLFQDQAAYAARALFHAARCFDLLGTDTDRLHAQRLYREVQRRFPGTDWANEARGHRR